MSSSGNIVKEAIADAERVRKLATEAAKKRILEELAPGMKRLVEQEIGNAVANEDSDRLRRAADGHGETEFEEGAECPRGETEMDKDELDMESLGAMFPGISETEEETYDMPEAKDQDDAEMDFADESTIPTLGEGEEEEEGEMDEEITLDEKGLKKAYERLEQTNAALAEAQVSSGFKDSYKTTEWETEDGAPPSDTGLMDKGQDGKGWEETKPPAATDYSVKEAIDRAISESPELRAYVSFLEESLKEANSVAHKLRNEVREVNLFNTKVLKVNEMLSKFGKNLTNEQKRVVIEKMDEAKTIREVKLVSESLERAFSVVTESVARRPKANAQRVRRSGGANQKVLRESVDKSTGNQYSRMQKLAGLNKAVQ